MIRACTRIFNEACAAGVCVSIWVSVRLAAVDLKE